MSKQAAVHHKKAAEHHEHAARHHKEAAKHHEAGAHEKAAHHAHLAHGHSQQAIDAEAEAAKAHIEQYGNKLRSGEIPVRPVTPPRVDGAIMFNAPSTLSKCD